MKKYFKYFSSKGALIGGALTLMLVCYFQQKESAKLRAQVKETAPTVVDSLLHTKDSLQNRIDSLESEMFPMEIELNRYQTAYKIFLERDPQGAKIYGDIISDETE